MNEETTPPQQQAEPVAWMCSAFDGEPCEQTNHDECENPIPLYTTPPLPVQEQQKAEPVAWDKPSASFNEWWDSYRHDGGNPFQTDSFAYWAFAGWKAALAQRPWQGLTKEYLAQIDTEEIYGVVGNHTAIAMAVEAKLRELNK